MDLEKRLRKETWKSIGSAGLIVLPIVGIWAFILGKNNYIKNHLEKDAIACNWRSNMSYVGGKHLPLLRNKDLDKDGLYESALFYKTPDGKIVYQEIAKNSKGTLVLNPQHFYK